MYVQSSRRPIDSKYGNSSFKLQCHFQLQIIIKPYPKNIQKLYLESLKEIGIDFCKNEIKFIEDNWENTTLNSWGVGWEVQLNGIEITQITYFQQIGGLNFNSEIIEITYGLERLSMIIQNIDCLYEIIWDKNNFGNIIKYKDLFYINEIEHSYYNIDYANLNFLFSIFKQYESEAKYLLSLKKPLLFPAYEYVLKAIHVFNLLESRKAISIYERQSYILRIQFLSKKIAKIYFESNDFINYYKINNN